MPLNPPTVIGPISECNDSIRVKGLRTGATVSIIMDGTSIGSGSASWPTETFPITTTLTAGRFVHARQELGGEISPAVPIIDRTEVQPAPADISSSFVHVDGTVYECGNCVQVSSAVPGAQVHVSSGAVERGVGTAVNGRANIKLSPFTSNGDILTVHQVACGLVGPSLEAPAENGFPGSSPIERLLRPRLKYRPRACDREIIVLSIAAGARVVAIRSSGSTHVGCTTGPELKIRVTPELQEGETIALHQEYTACGPSSDPRHSLVSPAIPVPIPDVFPSICAGATKVRIQGLRVGAIVHIFVNGSLVGDAEASDPAEVFQLPNPLSPGSVVTAAQTVCDIRSDTSNAVTVASAPNTVDTPSIAGPLHACAPAVKVENLTPGAQIMIRDRSTGAPRSDSEHVLGSVAVVYVSPALMAGEVVFATLDSCGVHEESDPVTVEAEMAEFRPPQIQTPIFDGADSIEIREVIPGATVEISQNDVWTYSYFAPQGRIIVAVDDLAVGTSLRARQRLCTVSQQSGRVVVRAPAPRIITESPLPDGQVGVPYSAQIAVTGGVAPLEWSRTSGIIPSGLALNTTTGALEGTPEIAGHYGIDVRVLDSGSPPASDERHFKIRTKDDESTTPSGARSVAVFNCHSERRAINIWTRDLTAATDWDERKYGLESQYDAAGSCPAADAEPFVIGLEHSHVYWVRVVDPGQLTCGNQNSPDVVGCVRYEFSITGNDEGAVFVANVV